MSKKTNLYLGKAGQFAAMSEFLCRGWNVAVPEVDVGDDIFVVRDFDGNFKRVQVKTATGKSTLKSGIRAQFSVKRNQLELQVNPMLVYAFLVRFRNKWELLSLIRRDVLLDYFQNHGTGSIGGENQVIFTFLLVKEKLFCGKQDISRHLGDFGDFPIIPH